MVNHKIIKPNTKFMFDRQKEELVKGLYAELKILFITSQFFGAAPPVLNFPEVLLGAKDENPWYRRLIKVADWLWSFILIAVILTATQFYQSSTVFSTESFSFLTRTIYMGEYVFAISMSIVSIIGGNILHRKYYVILEMMIEVDLILLRLGVKPKYTQMRRFITAFLIIVFCIMFVHVVIVLDHNYWDVLTTIFMVTIFTLPNIPWTLCLVQFIVVMAHLHHNYVGINSILAAIANDKRNGEGISSKERLFLNIFMKIEGEKCLNGADTVWGKVIESLRHLHASVGKIVEQLTNCFGFFLCGTIFTGFLTLIVEFFQIYRAKEGLIEYRFHQYFYSSLWIIIFGGRILAVLYASDMVSCAVSLRGWTRRGTLLN